MIPAVAAFVLMEAFTYAAHRWVMHGFAWVWHKSHHRPRPMTTTFEANDLFPVVFAAITILAMAAGTAWPQPLSLLVPVGAGITAYGAAYLFVHDVYIHQRAGGARLPRVRLLDRLAAAHALHHRFGGEPYGMLFPIVPRAVRIRQDAAQA